MPFYCFTSSAENVFNKGVRHLKNYAYRHIGKLFMVLHMHILHVHNLKKFSGVYQPYKSKI